MQRRFLMDKLLQEDEGYEKNQRNKGVCQSCGHYTLISTGGFGNRLCCQCKDKLSTELKKDFF